MVIQSQKLNGGIQLKRKGYVKVVWSSSIVYHPPSNRKREWTENQPLQNDRLPHICIGMNEIMACSKLSTSKARN
jgi:hypothetical protein